MDASVQRLAVLRERAHPFILCGHLPPMCAAVRADMCIGMRKEVCIAMHTDVCWACATYHLKALARATWVPPRLYLRNRRVIGDIRIRSFCDGYIVMAYVAMAI